MPETATPTSSPTALQTQKILNLLQSDGLLSRHLKGFESRPQQQQMMRNVIEAYNHDQIALIEAGTGTGKSLAYLLPAIIWAARFQERTVISTNTITLQEQLVHKDIPRLIETLNLNVKAVLVKGMNNYVCLRKFNDTQEELLLFPSEENEELKKIEKWLQTPSDGSRSEIPFVPTPPVWERIGAESETCSHNECPHFQECYFYKARRLAQDAQLLIVNHHLLFADLNKRAETNNYSEPAILPAYKRVVLDEAHHMEEIATEYFASRLNRLDLMQILGKLALEKQALSRGKLIILKEKIQLFFKKTPPREVLQMLNRLTIDLPALRHALTDKLHELFDACAHFIHEMKNTLAGEEQSEQKLRLLKEHHQHLNWNEQILPRVACLIDSLKRYHQSVNSLEVDFKLLNNALLNEQTKNVRLDIQALTNRLEMAIAHLTHFFSSQQNSAKVRWMESQNLKKIVNVQLVDADLDISPALIQFLFSKFPTIVLCSATLTSDQKFGFVRQSLGLTPDSFPNKIITENIYDSPFDFRNQALLAIPTDMPPPNHENFNTLAFENIWKAIQVSRGQAFVLFTSYNMLQSCANFLASRFEQQRYTLFKQGDDNRQRLLNQFKSTKGAVLFGTDSFWEGVDVAGDALRCVVIVKLPFKVPSEPIVQARMEAIEERGGNPFNDFAVPHAVVKFKQGFGRLIRNKWDRGCIVCLDTRLVHKRYGAQFLNSLPPCQKAFMPGSQLWPKLEEFYRQTYHYVKHNPVSID